MKFQDVISEQKIPTYIFFYISKNNV